MLTTPAEFNINIVWADPRSLAATWRISLDFYSLRYLDVSLPSVRLYKLLISSVYNSAYHCWVLPFGYPRIYAYLAAPRGLSQLITSFVASRCLGIHRKPLYA